MSKTLTKQKTLRSFVADTFKMHIQSILKQLHDDFEQKQHLIWKILLQSSIEYQYFT